jgi:hypothetical protein
MSDQGFDKILNPIGWRNGIRPAPTKPEPHWLVQFGWMIGLTVGIFAFLYLPEEF